MNAFCTDLRGSLASLAHLTLTITPLPTKSLLVISSRLSQYLPKQSTTLEWEFELEFEWEFELEFEFEWVTLPRALIIIWGTACSISDKACSFKREGYDRRYDSFEVFESDPIVAFRASSIASKTFLEFFSCKPSIALPTQIW
tara:strand:+ start:188 stop:616 length:429 start_codon:yes stop_codon:yes gene_type:complete